MRAPVNSFEFQPCGRTPQAGHLMVSLRHRTLTSPTPNAHRLGRGLPGYLILFAPTLSRLSVSTVPEGRLRHRPSSRYLRIPPLHREFRPPLTDSSKTVSNAVLGLSPKIPHQTCSTAYSPFKPSNSEQRLPPLSYRGCWHRVSRGLFIGYRHHLSQ